jgi:hypothetical protein
VTDVTSQSDGSVVANVSFTSNQAPSSGPNPGETCTHWTLSYRLVPAPAGNSLSYLIDGASPIGPGHVAC